MVRIQQREGRLRDQFHTSFLQTRATAVNPRDSRRYSGCRKRDRGPLKQNPLRCPAMKLHEPRPLESLKGSAQGVTPFYHNSCSNGATHNVTWINPARSSKAREIPRLSISRAGSNVDLGQTKGWPCTTALLMQSPHEKMQPWRLNGAL